MSKENAVAMLAGTPGITEAPASTTDLQSASAVPEQIQQMESSRLAIYAKKEAALVKEREYLKQQREQTAKEKVEYDRIVGKARQIQELQKTDPIAAMKEAGFTDTDIINYYAANQKKDPTPEEIARNAALDEIKKENEIRAKAQTEAQQKQNNELITNYKKNISQTITASKDKLILSNLMGPIAEEYAFMAAEECVKQGQDVPSPKEVAEMVEELLRHQYNEMKNILEPAKPVEESIVAKKPEQTSRRTPATPTPAKTLTNRVTPTVASTVSKTETRAEKRERLMRQLAGGS